jgi:hypothetical protein
MGLVKRRGARPVVITDAERSQEDQLRIRQHRYVVMMLLRVVCLVLAVILVSLQPPLVWLWVAICAAGMVVLPWIAVVLANDRLPKEEHRWRRPGAPSGGGTRAVPGRPGGTPEGSREVPPEPLNE